VTEAAAANSKLTEQRTPPSCSRDARWRPTHRQSGRRRRHDLKQVAPPIRRDALGGAIAPASSFVSVETLRRRWCYRRVWSPRRLR
jgi:hypothetical protein